MFLGYNYGIMRKSRWIIGIAVAIGTIPLVAYEQHRAREKYEAKREEACIQLSITLEQKYSCAEEAQSRHDYLPWWYVLAAWPEGIGAWVLILTGAAIAWQSNETSKAAKAALLNAQAVINAERPWIYAYVRPHRTRGGFKLSIKNRGRTPAMIVDCRMNYLQATSLNLLPSDAKYDWDTIIENKIVFPDSVAFAMWFDRSTVKRALGKDSLSVLDENNIFVCGRIRYRDLLNPNPDVIHETRWICGYQLTETGDEVQPIEGYGISGEYERYT